METSPTVKELQAALCDFQKEAITVQKNAENPGFKRGNKAMKYADLNSILAAVLPVLTKHGLAVSQLPDGAGLTTRIMHLSGEWMQATSTMQPVTNTPQALGSAITYARRYALGALLGIVTEDDDDANAASQKPSPEQELAAALSELTNVSSRKEMGDVYRRYAGLHNHPVFAAAAVGVGQRFPKAQPLITSDADTYNDERGA